MSTSLMTSRLSNAVAHKLQGHELISVKSRTCVVYNALEDY